MITGHRPPKIGGYKPNPTGKWIRENLHIILRSLKKKHPKLVAISGMALGVDTMFAEEALALAVPLLAALPCRGQDKMWPTAARLKYASLLAKAKKVHYVSPAGYTKSCMQNRNAYMVKKATIAIAVWDEGKSGGTYNAVKLLQEKGIPTIWLNPLNHSVSWLIGP